MEAARAKESGNIGEISAKQLSLEIARRKKTRTRVILGITLILVVISILNMYSTALLSPDRRQIIRNHSAYLLLALAAGAICSNISYRRFDGKRLCLLLLLGSVAGLVLMLVGHNFLPKFFPRINNTKSWMRLGSIGFQPAEFLKLPFIILIAHHLAYCEEHKLKNFAVVANVLPVYFVFAVLILLQNDLGTAIHYGLILCFMLFFARIDMLYILGAGGLALSSLSGLTLWLLSLGGQNIKGYKLKRIWLFITGLTRGEYDPDIGYQVGQSILAFGNGGWKGQGYSNGILKHGYLPETRTDFILATLGEEFGFIGLLVIFILFFLLFTLTRSTAMDVGRPFGRYLAVGIGGFLMTQMFINLFVVIGLLPVMGVPMPILSYGGTSILTIFLALSMIMNMNFQTNDGQ
ncbi:MAG: FtsW/RodA/SpoVE family cell cycle protein [Fusobacteriaceae bacterium]|jgi:cell division protein FtsW|nr:FtsW/RodA/SpoVE family cell cycle protein [Fusobacteriaceae bacterium]